MDWIEIIPRVVIWGTLIHLLWNEDFWKQLAIFLLVTTSLWFLGSYHHAEGKFEGTCEMAEAIDGALRSNPDLVAHTNIEDISFVSEACHDR